MKNKTLRKESLRTAMIVTGMLLALFIGMLDQTIVSTIVPTIVADIGGFEHYIWMFSGFMIALVIATPISGRCADIFGKKPVMEIGLIIFLIGSVLCATAANMTEMIVYRIIQGLGGGMLMPITFAVIADLFPEEKRGKINALFGGVAGVAAIVGPVVGAFLTGHLNWRWAFWVNLIVGIPAILFIHFPYKEQVERNRAPFDWLGSLFLVASLSCLMFALELGGKTYAWADWQEGMLFAGFGIALLLFILVERKAKNPVIDLGLFRNSAFSASQTIGFMAGAIMTVCTTLIPLFIQGVLGESVGSASETVTPLMLGLVAGTGLWGALINRFAYRNLLLPGVLLLLIPLLLLGQMDEGTSKGTVIFAMVLAGTGLGAVMSVLNLSAIYRVSREHHGTALALVSFFRNIGSAVGVAVIGALQMEVFRTGMTGAKGSSLSAADQIQAILQPELRNRVDAGLLNDILHYLSHSLAISFQFTVIFAAAALLGSFLLGKARVHKQAEPNGQESA